MLVDCKFELDEKTTIKASSYQSFENLIQYTRFWVHLIILTNVMFPLLLFQNEDAVVLLLNILQKVFSLVPFPLIIPIYMPFFMTSTNF